MTMEDVSLISENTNKIGRLDETATTTKITFIISISFVAKVRVFPVIKREDCSQQKVHYQPLTSKFPGMWHQ